MSFKTNYHTHNELCNHATGNCEDYVKQAIEFGFNEIGISDHNPVPREFMSNEDYENNWIQRNMKLDEFYKVYLPQLAEVIKKYGQKIKIYKGLECEYLPNHNEYYQGLLNDLDYLIVGIHFFIGKNDEIINSYSELNYSNVIDYAHNCVKAMESQLFTILVHPDLFMFNYKNVNGQREFDENAIKASKMIIEAAIKNDVYLEVNANGLANSIKYGSADNWLYPYCAFWELCQKEYPQAKIVIGADAHNPEDLDNKAVTQVKNFSKKIGLSICEKVIMKNK